MEVGWYNKKLEKLGFTEGTKWYVEMEGLFVGEFVRVRIKKRICSPNSAEL